MSTLQSRLQNELINIRTEDEETADDLKLEQELLLEDVSATIASDLKGMLPPEKEYKKLEPCWYCQGYQYSCCCGDAYNQALTDVLAIVDRYCGLTKEESK